MLVDGVNVEIEYPGFAQALSAVLADIASLASIPKIVGPETTGAQSAVEYAPLLDLAQVDALGHHLYDMEPTEIDRNALVALSEIGQAYQRPIFQTEMQADGLGTAVLVHNALVVGNASVYLQNDFVGPILPGDPSPTNLVELTETGFNLLAPYYALRHFARDTDVGWIRVAATATLDDLLSSAWLSPEGDALTIVVVNQGSNEQAVKLEFPEELAVTSRVTRTVFAGVERGSDLGPLPSARMLQLPAESVVTVVLQR